MQATAASTWSQALTARSTQLGVNALRLALAKQQQQQQVAGARAAASPAVYSLHWPPSTTLSGTYRRLYQLFVANASVATAAGTGAVFVGELRRHALLVVANTGSVVCVCCCLCGWPPAQADHLGQTEHGLSLMTQAPHVLLAS